MFNFFLSSIFRAVRAVRGMSKDKENRKFLFYSLYAWGVPLVISLIIFVVDFFQLFDKVYLPNFGESTCWFSQNTFGHIIYFMLPVGALVLSNFVLFILTTKQCNKVKKEIFKMQNSDGNNSGSKKKRFIADKAR